MKRITLTLISTYILTAVVCAGTTAAAREYVMGVHFESAGGMGSSQMFQITDSIVKLMGEPEYGIDFKLEKFPTYEAVMEAFKSGKLDGAQLYPEYIVELLDAGIRVLPLATYSVGGRTSRSWCLWQNKSGRVRTAKEIAGRSLILSGEVKLLTYCQIRNYLYEQGIDRPVWKVFDSFTRVQGQNSAFMALGMGKADFLWDSEDYDKMLKMFNPGILAKLSRDFCTEPVYKRPAIVFNPKKASREEYKEMQAGLAKLIGNLDRHLKERPDMKALGEYAKMTGFRFTAADENEFDAELAVFKLGRARGWYDEAIYFGEFIKKAKPGQATQLKPDYGYCRKTCEEAKDSLECMDDCMQ